MPTIEQIKEIRRANLLRLMSQYGQATLAGRLDVAAAVLYQFTKGKGKNRRNISDDRARQIEKDLRLEKGWMDKDHDSPAGDRVEDIKPKLYSVPSETWPFSDAGMVPRIRRLQIQDHVQLESFLQVALRYFEQRESDQARRSRDFLRKPAPPDQS